jgi:7,8-dihydropterin-6-yl-methyl-4-(beta-D-ribofuranosyl)aminobenzene 5'-phosphate synthase
MRTFVPVEKHLRIDGELTLFSGIPAGVALGGQQHVAGGKDGQLVQDSFDHEQNLLITQGDKLLLVAGCAHSGIANIVARAVELAGRPVDYVIGGFHLHSVGSQKNASGELIEKLARRLLETGARYWTCHCTGAEPYAQLKRIMGDRIEYLATGGVIEI